MLSDHHFSQEQIHFNEEQIDSIVRSSSMTQNVFEHLLECDACFANYESTRLLILALSHL
jgi:hypothetical protein